MTFMKRRLFTHCCQQALTLPWAAWILGGAAGFALLMAFVAQYGFDLKPCVLCLWQRGPFVLAIVLAGLILGSRRSARRARLLLRLMSCVFLVGAGIALFHSGVERHWWLGTAGCAIQPLGEGAHLPGLQQLIATAVARCDVIPWSFLGLSMANWNVPFSLALAVLAACAARGRR